MDKSDIKQPEPGSEQVKMNFESFSRQFGDNKPKANDFHKLREASAKISPESFQEFDKRFMHEPSVHDEKLYLGSTSNPPEEHKSLIQRSRGGEGGYGPDYEPGVGLASSQPPFPAKEQFDPMYNGIPDAKLPKIGDEEVVDGKRYVCAVASGPSFRDGWGEGVSWDVNKPAPGFLDKNPLNIQPGERFYDHQVGRSGYYNDKLERVYDHIAPHNNTLYGNYPKTMLTTEEVKEKQKDKEWMNAAKCLVSYEKHNNIPGVQDGWGQGVEWNPDIKPEKKDSNPKDAVGSKKVAMSVVSGPVMMEVALGMLEGALKYGRHNYREAGVRASIYYDAAMRHLMDWWEGTNTDPDSGLNHITKAITSLVVLRDAMIRDNWNDDRPPMTDEGWIQEFNKKAAEIIAKYPNPVPAYTQKDSIKK